MKLNIDSFKKVKEDNKTVVLRNDDGTEIKVAKDKLNHATRAKLSKMAVHMEEGGAVSNPDSDIMERMNQPATSRPTADWREYFEAMQAKQRDQDAMRAGEMQPQQGGRAPAGLLDFMQGVIEKPNPPAIPATSASPQEQSFNNSLMDGFVNPEKKPLPAPSPIMPQASAIEKQRPNFGNAALLGQRAPGAAPAPQMNSGYTSSLASDFGRIEKGYLNEARAAGEQANQEAMVAERSQADLRNLMATHQQRYNALNDDIAKSITQLQEKNIDPNHYWNSKSTASKISSTIGLILGGIGGALTGQENPALKFLNANIDRDIETQKSELGKQNTILSAYMNQTKNLEDATAMTKAFYLEKYAMDLRKAAASSQDKAAMARADQAIGKLNLEKHQILNQVSMRQTMMQNVDKVDPAMAIRFVVPENRQAEAYKELQEAQNMSQGRDNLLRGFDDIAKINTVGNRVMSPIQSKAQINAIKGPLLAKLSKDSAGKFTEADAEMLEHFFPAIGDNEQTLALKRHKMAEFVSEKMNYPLLKSYNIPVNTIALPRAHAAPAGYARK